MKIATYIAVLSLCTTGCAAIAEMQAKAEQRIFESAKIGCVNYGFKEGSDQFSQCLQTEVNNIKTRAAIMDAAEQTSATIEASAEETRETIKDAAAR